MDRRKKILNKMTLIRKCKAKSRNFHVIVISRFFFHDQTWINLGKDDGMTNLRILCFFKIPLTLSFYFASHFFTKGILPIDFIQKSKAVLACAYRMRGKNTFHFCKVKQFPAKFFGLSGLKLDKEK